MSKPNKKLGNIDVIGKYFYPIVAGIQINILETYSVLVEKGWDVVIHTSKDTLTEKNCLSDRDEIRGIKVKRYPFKWYGYFPDINWKTTKLICLHNFNIFPHFYILIKTLLLKVMGKKSYALVLTPHGFIPEWSIFNPVQRMIKMIYQYTIGVLLINLVVDAVRAVSESERVEMIKSGIKPKLIVEISNGIENEAFEDIETKANPGIKKMVKEFGNYIIQVGRIHPIKNYETVIKALSLLPGKLKFVIIGPEDSNAYKGYLEKLINSLGLKDRVIFVGVIKGIDKYYLMKKAQMMVLMSIKEAYSNVIHEGLSQGLICIVANNSSFLYLIKDGINGYRVETRNYKEVARKISFMLKNKDSEFIRNMKENSRSFGLKTSWKDVASSMHDLYRQIIDYSNKKRNKDIQKHSRIGSYYGNEKIHSFNTGRLKN